MATNNKDIDNKNLDNIINDLDDKFDDYMIRPMDLDDINEVIKAEEEVFGKSLGFDMLYTELKMNPFAFYFVLEVEEEFGGYIGSWIDDDHSEIINFLVKPEYQGNGFGALLLSFIIDLVTSVKVPTLSLEVRESNSRAIKLYEKFGFKYSHTRNTYYENGENALVLILEVNK